MSEDAGLRLAEAVDSARMELGLSKLDLSRLARVGRSTIADLINQHKVPGRAATRRRIEAALGWTDGTCEQVMDGQAPQLRADVSYPPSASAKVLVEQLDQITEEAAASAVLADSLASRLRNLADASAAAAHLARRHQK